MTNVKLEQITVTNWRACVSLRVAPDQHNFIPSNLYSIAEAQFYPEARSRAVVKDDGELIGYALFGRDVSSEKWKIFRVMIDAQHQGRGYGLATMKAILQEIELQPGGDQILICYKNNNHVARRLYERLDFQEISTDEEGKVTALRTKPLNGPL